MITTKDILYNHLENTQTDFDKKNKELLDDVESEIATAHVPKTYWIYKRCRFSF